MAKGYTRQKAKSEANLDVLGLEMGKKQPQAVDIEEAVLGALMLEQNAISDIVDILIPECFYKDAHKKIYKAIL